MHMEKADEKKVTVADYKRTAFDQMREKKTNRMTL